MSKALHVVTDEEADKMSNIYCTPEHLRVGRKAVKLLAKESGISKKGNSLAYITTPNKMNQLGLLYMPHDRLYESIYKYILTGFDVTSRYKVARPLRTKKASEVAEMIKDIYKAGPLRYPKTFQCDNGSEFKSDATKMLEGKGIKINRATTRYRHTSTAFVERYNNVLAERLFKPQDAQELVS
ncbi:uncharacterized protein LOC130629873 [Hydractinia symbiolongicarpus]|uniref:uncharacterized protein LOC130629873 n=1 Tax=Hydractinia symbiolongicarpus TaxID=13093 RepID=UPI00254FBCFD|nr:uncharacterized protein LOC130629873 [Hydractinia symbiolongicarpus]